jgi:predicted small secreted protein
MPPAVAGFSEFQRDWAAVRITRTGQSGYPTMRYRPFSIETASKAAVVALVLMTSGLLAGCQTDGASNPISELAAYRGKKDDEPKAAAKPPEPPMTRSQAASDCWMKLEKGAASVDLDKRADLVTKCIDDKMKSSQAPRT